MEMINFDNIKEFSTAFPASWSFLYSPEEASTIPEVHKDQIFFLNKEASSFLRNYLESSKIVTGPVWQPFNEQYFKTIKEFKITGISDKDIKKWLYNLGIPFDRFVFLDWDKSGQAVMLTWKMVIKYREGLFFADDITIFDKSLNWALFYFHEDKLFFGTDKIYDAEFEYEKAIAANELKNIFFNEDNLNFDREQKRNAVKAFKEKYDTPNIE